MRVDDKSCCKQCPDPKTNSENGTFLGDHVVVPAPPPKRTPEDILATGGCRLPNGEYSENNKEFSPRLSSFGEVKCVRCKCKVSFYDG